MRPAKFTDCGRARINMSSVIIGKSAGNAANLHAILAALRRTSRERDMADVAGLGGLLGTTAFCHVDCTCAEEQMAWSRLVAALGGLCLRAEPVGGVQDGAAYRIGRLGGRVANPRDRIRALLVLASDMRCPPITWSCSRHGSGVAATGLAAYGQWIAAMRSLSRLSRGRRQGLLNRSGSWAELRTWAAQFCLSAAGVRRTPWALDLRRAAEHMTREARLLADLKETLMRRQARINAIGVLEQARLEALEWTPLLCRAALTLAGTDPPVLDELCLSEDVPPDRARVGDLVYLARAGTEPFRLLAILRLARSDDPQARATLRECVHDRSACVSAAARLGLELPSGSSTA